MSGCLVLVEDSWEDDDNWMQVGYSISLITSKNLKCVRNAYRVRGCTFCYENCWKFKFFYSLFTLKVWLLIWPIFLFVWSQFCFCMKSCVSVTSPLVCWPRLSHQWFGASPGYSRPLSPDFLYHGPHSPGSFAWNTRTCIASLGLSLYRVSVCTHFLV